MWRRDREKRKVDRKERFGRKCIIGSRRYTDGRGMIYFLLFLCEDGKERPLDSSGLDSKLSVKGGRA